MCFEKDIIFNNTKFEIISETSRVLLYREFCNAATLPDVCKVKDLGWVVGKLNMFQASYERLNFRITT